MKPNPAPETCEYWWYREMPGEQAKVYGVRQFHGKCRAWHFSGPMRQVDSMRGQWSGPIACPFSD